MENIQEQDDSIEQLAEQQAGEEILLYSNDSRDNQPEQEDFHTVSVRLIQSDRGKLQGKRLAIYTNQYISVHEYRYKHKLDYWLNLAFVDATPKRHWKVNWRWAWLALILAGVGALAGFTPLAQILPELRAYSVWISAGFFALALLSVANLIRNSRRMVQFHSLHGQVPVLQLLNNNPDKQSFQHFLRELIERAQTANSAQLLDPSQQLAGELHEHRRLQELGVISEEQYQKAKGQILSLHST